MKIIPVIDLLDGQVVHARAGIRSHYQPLKSALCRGSEPLTVLSALIETYTFTHCYIADLNALMGQMPQITTLCRLFESFPHITFWLDSGISNVESYHAWHVAYASYPVIPILATETLVDIEIYRQISILAKNHILCLDMYQGVFLGDSALMNSSDVWSDTIIFLNRSHVGTSQGVDITSIIELQRRAPQLNWVAAGGVKQFSEIERLASEGIWGVLVATALHDRSLQPERVRVYAD